MPLIGIHVAVLTSAIDDGITTPPVNGATSTAPTVISTGNDHITIARG